MQTRQFVLAARPVGLPKESDFRLESVPMPQAPPAGGVLLRTLMLSLDPAMRGWMNEGRSYIPPVGIGEVMRAGGIARVIASDHPDFQVGQHVSGMTGVQEHLALDARGMKQAGLAAIDTSVAPPPVWLNALGMPGMTAYFGLLDVGLPRPGDTVVVSGAAGAVGQTVGQIAKIKGCRVVGIAGGPDKCALVEREFGFDACIDYKAGDLRGGLKTHCPEGVDVYFDNVGGEVLDTVLTRIRPRARIVICGAISQYNATQPVKGPSNYLSLLVNRARMEGMVVFDWADRYPEAIRAIGGWIGEGRLRTREDVVDGFERFPEALNMLFAGTNVGKLCLRLGE